MVAQELTELNGMYGTAPDSASCAIDRFLETGRRFTFPLIRQQRPARIGPHTPQSRAILENGRILAEQFFKDRARLQHRYQSLGRLPRLAVQYAQVVIGTGQAACELDDVWILAVQLFPGCPACSPCGCRPSAVSPYNAPRLLYIQAKPLANSVMVGFSGTVLPQMPRALLARCRASAGLSKAVYKTARLLYVRARSLAKSLIVGFSRDNFSWMPRACS